jgi:preprotein translocase subunit SecE
MRHLPWVILVDVIATILVILLVSAMTHSGFGRFGIADFRIFGSPIALSTAIAFGTGIATFVFLVRYKRAMTFTDEVIGELFKVTWPSREETLKASITVVATTVFTAALLAAYDYIWKNVADFFL